MRKSRRVGWRTYVHKHNFKYDEWLPQGISGSYHTLPFGLGIKVYFMENPADTPQEATRSVEWFDAVWALRAMRRAYSSGITPKVYGICAVRSGRYWHPALVMQHIKGDQPCFYHGSPETEKFERKLKRFGIEHYDVHQQNLIMQEDTHRVYVIDYDGCSIDDRLSRIEHGMEERWQRVKG